MALFGKPTPQSFARDLVKAIRKLSPDRRYEFDEDGFRLIRQDSKGVISLTNLFAEYGQLSSAERKQHLARLASVFATDDDDSFPDTFEEAKAHLRPKVFNRATFEFMRFQAKLSGDEPLDLPLYPLGEHLYGSIVFDTENAMRSINKQQLEDWGANYYEAFEIACENLAETSIAYSTIGDRFHSAISGDNYDSSRIFLTDTIQRMEVSGDVIGMVPQRDAMYITGSEDVDGLRIMLELTRQTIEEQPRPLAPIPLRLVDGQWESWTLPEGHELKSGFAALERDFLGQLYSQQQELLNAVAEQGEPLPFVASFSGLQHSETGEVTTYCVWGEGVDSLLPKTDFIALIDESRQTQRQKWDVVASVVGPLLSPDDSYYPVRYRCREFPGPALLAEIGTTDDLG